MPNTYKKTLCIIKNRDCDDANTCDDCYIAAEERKREQEEINAKYKIDLPAKIGDRRYKGNHHYTVIKAESDDLEYISKIINLKNPKELLGTEYVWDAAKYYPEWEKTKEILKITETPDKILFEKNKPLIVFSGKEIYVIAPRLDG
jgi:hypothetical protein